MARNPERIDVMIDRLREQWKSKPDMRLGQLIAVHIPQDKELFQLEDNEWPGLSADVEVWDR